MSQNQNQEINVTQFYEQIKQVVWGFNLEGGLQDYLKKVKIMSSDLTQDQQIQSQQFVVDLKNYIDQKFQQYQAKNQLSTQQLQPSKVKRLYVDGCFDLMHSGHFNALRQAKQFAETLVVGVISHEQVCQRKGTPILAYDERLTLAKSCKWVDEIYENAPYDATIELLDKLNCSHTAHGDDMIITPDGEDAFKPFKDAGRMIVFKRTEGISTTDIVGRLLLMTKGQVQDKQFKKKMRKVSGDQPITTQNLQNYQDSSEDEANAEKKIKQEFSQNSKSDELKITSVKMVNTTRRIRQFSQDHKEPKEGDKIIYIDGSFDLLNVGHVKALETAKQQGDYLIVGVHDDDIINKHKGQNYPILQLQERVLNILALKYVDEVVIGAPYGVSEQFIKQFSIDLVVEGNQTGQNQNSEAEDPYAVPKKMGIFKYIDSQCSMNIDTIIERIFTNRMQFLEIYNKKAKKQQDYYDTTERAVKEQ